MPAQPRPLPAPDQLTEPFWESARVKQLRIQRCSACGYYNHPPKPLCDRCSSPELTFEAVSGRGRVYSYTVMHQRNIAGFEDQVPYVNLLVELDEQPQLLLVSNLSGEGSNVAIGKPVQVTFETVAAGVVLPQFEIVD